MRTITQYAQLCDEGRFGEWADLFTEGARFHVMSGTREGREAIEAFITKAMPPDKRGKHANVGTVIDVASDGLSAQAWTDFLFVTPAGAVSSLGRYHDELELGTDARWRFALREIVFVGSNPELAKPLPG